LGVERETAEGKLDAAMESSATGINIGTGSVGAAGIGESSALALVARRGAIPANLSPARRDLTVGSEAGSGAIAMTFGIGSESIPADMIM
jgi:hypothetical protein